MSKEHMFSFAIQLPSTSLEANGDSCGQGNGGPIKGFIGITAPPEIFYIFDEPFWGKGYATEALEAYLKTYWARYPDGLVGVPEETRDYLEADVVAENSGSENVLKKNGFECVRGGIMRGNGREVPTKVFRVMRPVRDTN